MRKTGWLSAPLSPSPSVLFTWWIYDDVTSDNQEGQAEVTPYGVRILIILPYISPLSSLRLPLFHSSYDFLHERLYHRSQSPLKQTSVGSLSNSTGLLHHNRPPAVIVDILPATTLRGEEVQSNRAARAPLWHQALLGSREQEQRELFLSPVAQCAKLVIIGRRRWGSNLWGNKVPNECISFFLSFFLVLLPHSPSPSLCVFHLSSPHASLSAPLPRSWHQHR